MTSALSNLPSTEKKSIGTSSFQNNVYKMILENMDIKNGIKNTGGGGVKLKLKNLSPPKKKSKRRPWLAVAVKGIFAYGSPYVYTKIYIFLI